MFYNIKMHNLLQNPKYFINFVPCYVRAYNARERKHICEHKTIKNEY